MAQRKGIAILGGGVDATRATHPVAGANRQVNGGFFFANAATITNLLQTWDLDGRLHRRLLPPPVLPFPPP